MSSAVGKWVFGKVLKETTANKFGQDEDPYFEVPAQQLSKARRWKKRQRKALPPGLTEEEGKILTKVKRRAYRIDMCFGSFCGIKVGWGGLLGIIPLIGDAVDTLLCLMVVKTACQLQLPMSMKIIMLLNIAFDFAIGLIPLVGDLVDIMYKCSTRNAIMLERHLRRVGAARLKNDGVNPSDIEDPSLPNRYDSEDEEADVQRPERARSKRERRGEKVEEPSSTPGRTKSKRHNNTYR